MVLLYNVPLTLKRIHLYLRKFPLFRGTVFLSFSEIGLRKKNKQTNKKNKNKKNRDLPPILFSPPFRTNSLIDPKIFDYLRTPGYTLSYIKRVVNVDFRSTILDHEYVEGAK